MFHSGGWGVTGDLSIPVGDVLVQQLPLTLLWFLILPKVSVTSLGSYVMTNMYLCRLLLGGVH